MKLKQSLNNLKAAYRNILSDETLVQLRKIQQNQQQVLLEQDSLLAMNQLSKLFPGYLPWTSSSMRPGAIMVVINDIVLHRRNICFECGTGLSTIFIASILREQGGHLYSVEHDSEWASFMEDLLKRNNLNDLVSLIFAPLETIKIGPNSFEWYKKTMIIRELGERKIDLLLVDGPPAFTKETKFNRYPALPLLTESLADDYTIFLDDANREGEQCILRQWESEFSVSFELRLKTIDMAIGRPAPRYNI